MIDAKRHGTSTQGLIVWYTCIVMKLSKLYRFNYTQDKRRCWLAVADILQYGIKNFKIVHLYNLNLQEILCQEILLLSM